MKAHWQSAAASEKLDMSGDDGDDDAKDKYGRPLALGRPLQCDNDIVARLERSGSPGEKEEHGGLFRGENRFSVDTPLCFKQNGSSGGNDPIS